MRAFTRVTFVAALVFAWCPARSAAAADSVRLLLDDAGVAGEKGDVLRAAELFGEAVAIAQSKDDLVSEGECASAIDSLLIRIRDPRNEANRTARSRVLMSMGDFLGTLLGKLDASRRGVSHWTGSDWGCTTVQSH